MKRMSLVLVVIMLVSLIGGSLSYAAATTQQDQAVVLNAIKILKGNENGYNLSGKLRRSEAATLVVRMLGEEAKVLGNKGAYTVTAFPDVKSTDWFAPYVGYCYKNGIILGINEGNQVKFKPNDYISEKSFAQLVLGVMGYKSGSDFSWETVKRFMYDKGLVTDVVYTVSNEDNTSYTRGEAVTLLYNSLTKKRKGTNKTVCELLIDKKVTNQSTAKKYGLIKYDEEATKIEKVTVTDVNTLEVEMNEPVIVDALDIEVYANSKLMVVDDFETKASTIKIKVDGELYNEREFNLKIQKVYDDEDNLVKDLEKKFDGIERPEIQSKLFKISRIKPISAQMLEISFTQPIDDSAEQVLLYEVYRNGILYFEGSYKTLEVKKNTTVDNGVIFITKQHKFEEGNRYEVRIKSDLKSKYKAYLNDGQGDRYSFYGSAIKSEKFEIIQAEFLDTDNIVVVFSDLVDKESATTKSNYYLKDEDNRRISVNSAYLDEYDEDHKYKRVILRTQDLKDYHEYTLFVEDVENVFKTLRIENYNAFLGEGMKNDEEVYLKGIDVINRTMIQLVFEKPLDDASEKARIKIDNGISVKKKLVDPDDPRKLNVYLSKSRYLKEDKDYTITIDDKGIQNIYGNTHEDDIIEDFDGMNNIPNEIVIEDAHFISDTQILVKFSDYVKESSIKSESNYSFEYEINGTEKKLFVSDIEVVDARTAIINFDYLIQGGRLYIKVDNVYDISSQYQYDNLKEKVELLKN